MSSDVIRGHQRSSEVCIQRYAFRGMQPEVIRGYQRSAVPAFGARTTAGSSHKEFPNKEFPNKESTASRS
jgi:hypothetical protein